MLALFYGTNRTEARTAAADFLTAQAAEATVEVIDDASYTSQQLSNMIGATSLFGGTQAYLLDTPSLNSEFETEVYESLSDLASSSHVFAVLESSLLAPVKKRYARHTDTISEFVADKPGRFDAFAVADALAKKDKKNLWVLLQEAKLAGLRPEELVGMLWWQLKALRLAALTNSAAQAGMKDYPYRKAKQSLRNYKDGEVEKMAQALLVLYHEAHQGKGDMELRLEEWALSI